MACSSDRRPLHSPARRSSSLEEPARCEGKSAASVLTWLQVRSIDTNTVDRQAWLAQTLERLANRWPSGDIDALMPWNYMA